jgi:sugar/nucleoside kinase (ribokinase family)
VGSTHGSVSYDVVCAGAVTLDITLAGLEELPRPGEERFGTDLVFSPGAFATIAVGAAHLGLRAAVAAPRPRDLAGQYVASFLAEAGVDWLGAEIDRSAVTLVFPLEGERALASYDPRSDGNRSGVEGLEAAAFICGAGDLGEAPRGARVYLMAGDQRVRLEAIAGARAIFANEAEAGGLTGERDPARAARELGRFAGVAVVTGGRRGAVACERGEVAEVSAPGIEIVDTTGAGDLFAAAFVWADSGRLTLHERLCWATLYASLSIGKMGAAAGAATLGELLERGRDAGLVSPEARFQKGGHT